MKHRIKNIIAVSIIPQIILVKWLGQFPELIERYYSRGIYPVISKLSRIVFGWIPFSVGDLIYALLILLSIRYCYTNRRTIWKKPKLFLRNIVVVLSVVYFIFHLLWGFNYYRQPISNTLKLKETYTEEELISFVRTLIKKTNDVHYGITADSSKIVQISYSKEVIFNEVITGYEMLEKKIPFLKYKRPSLKKSLFSTPLSYMGYSGYLNPFTNEAQLNKKIPVFKYPIVSSHEVGHQIGYSAENETNFIGYLATVNHSDPYFQYSAYAYALSYCLRDIKRRDESTFLALYDTLNSGVKKNYKEVYDFWKAYKNPLEPVFKSMFNSFLKANNQKQGIKSYNFVVSLLVAYHQQYPLE